MKLVNSKYLFIVIIVSFLVINAAVYAQEKQISSFNHGPELGRGTIKRIAWHPEGSALAVASTEGIWLYTRHLEEIVHVFVVGEITALEWSPNGAWLAAKVGLRDATENSDQWWQFWAVGNKQLAPVLTELTSANTISWNVNGSRLVLLNEGSLVIYGNLIDQPLLKLASNQATIAKWSDDGSQLAIVNEERISIYDANDLHQIIDVIGNSSFADVWWSPDGTKIATKAAGEVFCGDNVGQITVWNVYTGAYVAEYNTQKIQHPFLYGKCIRQAEYIYNSIGNVVWSLDSRVLIIEVPTFIYTSEAVFFDLETQTVYKTQSLGGRIIEWQWTLNGRNLIVTLQTSSPYLFVAKLTLFDDFTLPLHDRFYQPSPDGSVLAATTYSNGRVRFYNSDTLELHFEIDPQSTRIRDLAWHPDGLHIAIASEDEIQLWDTQTSMLVASEQSFFGYRSHVIGLSPNGKFFAIGSSGLSNQHVYGGGSIRIYDMSALRLVATLRGHEHTLVRAIWKSDSTIVSQDMWNLRWWNVESATLMYIEQVYKPDALSNSPIRQVSDSDTSSPFTTEDAFIFTLEFAS